MPDSISQYELIGLIENLVNKKHATVDENDDEYIVEFNSKPLKNYYCSLVKVNKKRGIKRSTLTIYDSGIQIHSMNNCTSLYHCVNKVAQENKGWQ